MKNSLEFDGYSRKKLFERKQNLVSGTLLLAFLGTEFSKCLRKHKESKLVTDEKENIYQLQRNIFISVNGLLNGFIGSEFDDGEVAPEDSFEMKLLCDSFREMGNSEKDIQSVILAIHDSVTSVILRTVFTTNMSFEAIHDFFHSEDIKEQIMRFNNRPNQ